MAGLVQSFAAQLGWRVREYNVVVEGTSDATLFRHTASLYSARYGVPLFDSRFAVLAAGVGNEGGVDGLNKRLNAARQIAKADLGPDGALQFRFIGLYDNDDAGRQAAQLACEFDVSLQRYRDVFLLQPIMPLAKGAPPAQLKRLTENANQLYERLDWELEDLLSSKLLSAFERDHPDAVEDRHEKRGRTHRELTDEGKSALHLYAKEHASLEDLIEIVKTIKALHDYFRLPIAHIQC